jgi:8-oxo-dGTP pyrophosphatase MutT (NUDIX family)
MDDFVIPDLHQRLARRLRTSLPGPKAQRRFSPELCYGRHFGPPSPEARPAGVLVLLYRERDQWRLPLMLRPEHMKAHAGQVSFPGGRVEAGETSDQAALRELEEELGIPPQGIEVLGHLSPLYVFNSNFWITPWVAFTDRSLEFRPHPDEVAAVVTLTLATLRDRTSVGSMEIDRRGLTFRTPYIEAAPYRIWGATCMILGELIAVLDEITANESLS